jgi:signal transduction histidine kinase
MEAASRISGRDASWVVLTELLIIVILVSLTAFLKLKNKAAQARLSGLLIDAEEKERSRVASELHDDFSQRLAVIALKLENVSETVSPMSKEAERQFHEIVNSVSELGADLHTLSHQLHPSVLESLGLVPAITGLCKEFTAQHGVEVGFTSDDVPRSVHPDAALCMYRIVQEGLRNFIKHSGAQQALVSLRVNAEKLSVSVLDKGCGFDMQQLSDGLGVWSMEGRVRALGGDFMIQSAPGKGTTVSAWVPLAVTVGWRARNFQTKSGS